MPDTHNDGTMQYGSQAVTINSVAYDLKDIKVTAASSRYVQKGIRGLPQKAFRYKGITTGSATAQLAALDTVAPAQHTIFTLVPAGGGTPKQFIVEEVGETYEQESEVMCPFTFSEILNP